MNGVVEERGAKAPFKERSEESENSTEYRIIKLNIRKENKKDRIVCHAEN